VGKVEAHGKLWQAMAEVKVSVNWQGPSGVPASCLILTWISAQDE